MNTLVLNLTRFGDLLQTQPVIAGLKARGGSVDLVCLENFAEAANLLEEPDHVHSFPGAGLLAGLDRGWPLALHRLHTWRERAWEGRDLTGVLNLTPTQSARLLARVTAPLESREEIAGFGLDGQGFGYYGNTWAAFLQMSSTHRGSSPFNLVDVMLRSAGLPVAARPLALKKPGEGVLRQAMELLQAQAPAESKGFVAFQLGASEERRQWPEAYFAQLGKMLWEKMRFCPVLLGTKTERALAESYSVHADAPSIDLVGRTSLSELAAVLCQSRLLVTNDTGTMHLAAGLNRPIVAIFLATAQPWDTGPYQEGCLCLEPGLDCHPCSFGQECPHEEACRRAINAEQVYALLVRHFFPEAPGGNDESDLWLRQDGARAWQTGWDSHGYMNLAACTDHETSVRTQWIRVQRHFYRQFLDQDNDTVPAAYVHCLPEEVVHTICESLEQARALLHLLNSQAQVLTRTPLPKIQQKFLAYWERLQAHWQDDPFFTVLGRLWLVESQESGHDLRNFQELTRRYLHLTQSWQAMLQSPTLSVGTKIESP